MKFAIRDDDTCFFTKPEELERAYDFVKDGPVSLSIVPFAVPIHTDCVVPYGKNIPFACYSLADNRDLVEYLKNGIKANQWSVLLHGYSHEYQKVDGVWKAEMLWKSKERLLTEITKGKTYLEELLDTKISVFVAPNNSIDAKAIAALEANGMDYSGILLYGDRAFDFYYVKNFCKRWFVRATKKIQYPGVLKFRRHKELTAYTLGNFDRLVMAYQESKKRGEPFCVYTHYWDLLANPSRKEQLRKIYQYAMDDGAQLVSLSECFDD
jgi:peptidoglycan/xylan/chitin deacetylase (PgdA/CDA1 family)